MKISIIGSCQSRDIFNSKFIEDYKDYFKVMSYYTMTSMLSVMSKSINYNYNQLVKSDLSDFQMEHWYNELEKPILKTLESKKPDVLLLDFYADARYGARSYGGEYVVDRLAKLKDKDILDWNKFGIVYSYKSNTSDFITMWKNRFDRFMEFMSENLPDTQIIINTIKGTNIVTDKNGNIYVSPKAEDLDVDAINSLWEEFDNYAINQYGLKAITYADEYTLDPDYEYGLGVALVHFHKEYYRDCFDELLRLTYNVKEVQNQESHTNLVPDSAFRDGLNNWTNVAGKYELIDYPDFTAIRALDCRKKLGAYRPQAWTRPIEIEGSGKIEYTLSFYIKFADMSKIKENEVIFGIRTYKYVREVKSAEALEEYRLTLENHNVREGKEYRYTYTFTPRGRFIRLAPFMFRYLPGVEYSRIKLERSATASEYTK